MNEKRIGFQALRIRHGYPVLMGENQLILNITNNHT